MNSLDFDLSNSQINNNSNNNSNNRLLGLSCARKLDHESTNNGEAQTSSKSFNKEIRRINSTLRLATDEEKLVYLHYKSGVVYEGTLKDNLKSGHGTFEWPNGDKYTGEFKLNCRHGYGTKYALDKSRQIASNG